MTVQDDGGMLTWPQWPRVDDRGLARFVTPQASRWLPLPISRFDLGSQLDQRRIIAGAIYDALKERNIRYALEEYHPSQALQTIRTPPEILVAPREGTCLDLAALYSGLCLASELLPVLIVIEGHALAAVSLTHGVRDWNGYRPGRELFAAGPLGDAQALRDLIDEESFLAVECTGFAHSDQLGQKIRDMPEAQHRTGGVLTFDQAVDTGRQQLDWAERPFQFAIDIAVAHYGWRIEPQPLEMLPGASMTSIFRLLATAPAPLAPHLRSLTSSGSLTSAPAISSAATSYSVPLTSCSKTLSSPPATSSSAASQALARRHCLASLSRPGGMCTTSTLPRRTFVLPGSSWKTCVPS
jgi:hypothetical protein